MDSPWQTPAARADNGSMPDGDHHSMIVSIATWFLTSVFVIMYIAGQGMKYTMVRRFRGDDFLLLLATTLATGLSVVYYIAAANGFGDKGASEAQLEGIQKALYAADMLYIATVCCVKASLLLLLCQFTAQERHARVFASLAASVGCMAVASIVASALQCSPPRRWEILTAKCFNQSGFWIGFGVLDMLSDVCIVLSSALLVWDTRLPLSKKAVVVGCFMPRILVIAAAICRLAYLVPSMASGRDPASTLWISVVCREVQVCLSISTACIPGVKPLFAAIEAGLWQSDDLRTRGLSLGDLHKSGYSNI